MIFPVSLNWLALETVCKGKLVTAVRGQSCYVNAGAVRAHTKPGVLGLLPV